MPWQIKSTFVIPKYFLISYHFEFCTHACKIQFCFKNSRSTSSGRSVWFGYFSRSGAAVNFLNDQTTYLGTQLESEFGGERCFGVLAGMDFILISTYGPEGEAPELVLYKKR